MAKNNKKVFKLDSDERFGSVVLKGTENFVAWEEKDQGKFFTDLFAKYRGAFKVEIPIGYPIQVTFLKEASFEKERVELK